ncbi:metalloregulator ArsR/SmtB family transcription factor [Aliihoeflea aestuarii]|jgi:ArsR family transcriptional regulator, arsenate/arsenite/antimonite-responsive transcriptional repressor|uniref:ArsR/SmtB family transcription factor n=1 Tax=Aliihoeflea aestuarii TaxID=453840 RepID=UPI002094DDC1|nr:metalloregulator ArsR/SmtB family transcription factor [Aliihoeflea aestuarii]MCO6392789.1 metalloregulator ArsR/SmtB family transcription factor [Aliihoeflea aestuarii]
MNTIQGSPTPIEKMLAGRLGALAHPARLRILQHLSGHPACCCKEVVECLDLAQSTVSQHLKILVDAGLVIYRPERPRSVYQVDRAALAGLSTSLAGLIEACCAGEPQSCKDKNSGN